jgi:hypothetical protein
MPNTTPTTLPATANRAPLVDTIHRVSKTPTFSLQQLVLVVAPAALLERITLSSALKVARHARVVLRASILQLSA